MKPLKDVMMESMQTKYLSKGHVTTMSYDLEVKDDSNINQEIKDILMEYGWNFTVPEQRIVKYVGKKMVETDADTPNTTAWKEGVSPCEAVEEFCAEIEAYNTKHALDNPMVLGRGKAFATSDNEYDAIKIS